MHEVLARYRGQGLKTRLFNPYDEIWDRRLGVRTFGYHPATSASATTDLRLHYTPTPYREIFRALRAVGLSQDDVFTDLGSGLGRAVFAASWMGAARAVGIEVVEQLCDSAVENLRSSRLADRNIEFMCTDALNCDMRDTTVLYIFHSFGEPTLRRVMGKLEAEGAQARRRPLRIIYRNPVYDGVLQQLNWLQCVGRIHDRMAWPSTAPRYFTTLWQAIP